MKQVSNSNRQQLIVRRRKHVVGPYNMLHILHMLHTLYVMGYTIIRLNADFLANWRYNLCPEAIQSRAILAVNMDGFVGSRQTDVIYDCYTQHAAGGGLYARIYAAETPGRQRGKCRTHAPPPLTPSCLPYNRRTVADICLHMG